VKHFHLFCAKFSFAMFNYKRVTKLTTFLFVSETIPLNNVSSLCSFGPFKLSVQMNRGRILGWPPSGEKEAAEEDLKSSFAFDRVSCGDSPCTFHFDVYKYPNKRPTNPAAAAKVTLDLTSTTL